MSKLTTEAILAQLSQLSDNNGRAMSFKDGNTIVPNSLLQQVWLEAEKRERNRILGIAQKITFKNWNGHDLLSLQDLEEHVTDEYK